MNIKYHFIGWCKEGNHDKVWGIIQLTNNENPNHGWFNYNDFVTVWGRRGKALQTKIYKNVTKYDMDQLAHKKMHKSKPEECYQKVNKNKLDDVYPEFEKDLEETAFWSKLKL